MTLRRPPQENHKQTGLALLILVMVLVIGAITYVVSGISLDTIEQDRKLHTQQVLKQAKQALIAYAVNHADGAGSGDPGEFGILPCPDITAASSEGNQDPTCGSGAASGAKNVIGFFPWKAVELPPLYDGDGTCLMYAVSSTYKNKFPATMLNEDTYGMFQVVDSTDAITQGVNAEDRPVAIVFAPGKALLGQARAFTANTDCGQNYGNVTAYLEGNGVTDNGVLSTTDNDIDQFIHATATSINEATPYNDRFITITRDEIWSAIVARSDFQNKMEDLTEALAICLAKYANDNINVGAGSNDVPYNIDDSNDTGRRLPWPVKLDLSGASFADNDSYTDDDDMEGVLGDGFAGRYPYRVNKSNTDLALGGTDVLFDRGVCGATGPLTNGNVVDLSDANSEFRKLYFNWKDHFFYILSDAYKPVAGGSINECNGNTCVSVDGVTLADKRAGIVIYAGTRSDDVISDVTDAFEYIEATNDANFPVYDNPNPVVINENGGNEYQYNNGNDVMFCITNEATHTFASVWNPTPAPGSFVLYYTPVELSVNACP